MKYKTEHMRENIHLAKDAKIIYTTGFFITSNFEALMLAAKYAHENNIPFAFNLSALFLIEGHKTEFLEMTKYADFIFGNEDEAKAWGRAHAYPTESIPEITAIMAKLEKLNTSRPRHVIITQGKDPVIHSKHCFATNETTTREFPVTLIPASKVVDLNGAGDAFVGGFLA
jgi:nucleoside diphosphate kinase